jgi:hypothetical protein
VVQHREIKSRGFFLARSWHQCGASSCANFRPKSAPRIKSSLPACKSEGVFDYQNWGLAMGPVHSPHGVQGRPERASREVSPIEGSSVERSGFDGDEDGFDEYTDDDVVSLLEENARLRKLVVRLSELVLRNVVDGK